MFVLFFIALKSAIRRIFFKTPNRKLSSMGNNGISLPFKVLFKFEKSMSRDEVLQNLLGAIVSTWYSVYSLYKALKKYNDLKYVVSLTRNMSRLTGWICSLWIPMPLRYVMYGGFARTYGINMEEVEHPDFGHYETFTKFFTRHLKAGVRPVSEPNNEVSMCSPCDGTVLTCGKINSQFSTIDCVKGRSYRLDEFMLGVKGDSIESDQIDEIENNTAVSAMLDKVKTRGN